MKPEEKISVKITGDNPILWYKKGEIHEVGNYISFDWHDGEPHFEKEEGYFGIALKDCEIISPAPLPEYTMDELVAKVGHKFTLKIEHTL